jgi:hypothetical protein
MNPTLTYSNVSRRKAKPALRADIVAGRFLLLVLVGFLTYGASSLMGNTMLEDARRSAIRSKERAREMRLQVTLLSRQNDRLSNMHAIESWAGLRGFARLGNTVDPMAEDRRVVRR